MKKIVIIWHSNLKEINREKFNYLQNGWFEIIYFLFNYWKDTLFNTKFEYSKISQIKNINIFFNWIEPIYFFKIWEFIKYIKQINPDIVHVENPTWSFVLLQLILTKLLYKLKFKIVVFSWLNLPYPNNPKFWLYRLIEKFNFKYIDSLICWNQDWRKLFIRYWFKKNIVVIPQIWIETNFFIKKDVSELKENLKLSKENIIIWSIWRLVQEKWIQTLFHSFRKIFLWNKNLRLLIVWRWPYKEELLNLSKNLMIENSIIRVDSVSHEQVVDYINLCDIHVLCSIENKNRKEQFWHILIECMSCWVSVVGSDCWEIPNVIWDSGLIFKQWNIDELTQCLQKLINDENLKKELIIKWKKRVENLYTNERLAKQISNVYNKLF